MINYLKDNNFKELIKKDKMIVDFYADWCGPCKMIAEELESLTDCNILKVNVDEHNDLAKEYGVMSIPNVFFFKDGEVKNQVVGYQTREDIKKIYDNL